MFKLLAFAALVAVATAEASWSSYSAPAYGYGGHAYGGHSNGLVAVALVDDHGYGQRYNGPIVRNNPVKTAIVATPVLSSVPVVRDYVSTSPLVEVSHDGHTGHIVGHTQTVKSVIGTAPAVKTVALPAVVGPVVKTVTVPAVAIVGHGSYGHGSYGHGYGHGYGH